MSFMKLDFDYNLIMKFILSFDHNLTVFLANIFPKNFFSQSLFSFFSIQGVSFFFWLLIIILVIYFEERKHPGISKKDRQFIFSFLLGFILTVFIVELPLKNFFQRPRPYLYNSNQFEQLSTNFNCSGFSFPSGHAATAFASATILAFFDKKRGWFYYLIAFLIAYSRIFLYCHYFLDVLAGGLLGHAIGKMVLGIKRENRILKKSIRDN